MVLPWPHCDLDGSSLVAPNARSVHRQGATQEEIGLGAPTGAGATDAEIQAICDTQGANTQF